MHDASRTPFYHSRGRAMVLGVILIALTGVAAALSNSFTQTAQELRASQFAATAAADTAAAVAAPSAEEDPKGIEKECEQGTIQFAKATAEAEKVGVTVDEFTVQKSTNPCVVLYCSPPGVSPQSCVAITAGSDMPAQVTQCDVSGGKCISGTERTYKPLSNFSAEELQGTSFGELSDAFGTMFGGAYGGTPPPIAQLPKNPNPLISDITAGVFGDPSAQKLQSNDLSGLLSQVSQLSGVPGENRPPIPADWSGSVLCTTKECSPSSLINMERADDPIYQATFVSNIPTDSNRAPESSQNMFQRALGGLGALFSDALGGALRGIAGALTGAGQGGGGSGPGGSTSGSGEGNSQCTAEQFCEGTALKERDASCKVKLVQTCPFGCVAGGCASDPGTGESGALKAELSCSPKVVDVGAPIALSWNCTNADTSSGDGFETGGKLSGPKIIPTDDIPIGLKKLSYILTCKRQESVRTVACEIALNRPVITIVANPNPAPAGREVNVGWISGGTTSCDVASEVEPVSQDVNDEGRRGVITLPSIRATTTVAVRCDTVGGGEKIGEAVVVPEK